MARPRTDQLYLDNNATAPLRPEAEAAMRDAMGPPANPSSVHGFGRTARLMVEDAREAVAGLAGCDAQDVVFTSGGTESNNLVLMGFQTVVTSAVEHDSVLAAARDGGRRAILVGVDDQGRIDLNELDGILGTLDEAARRGAVVSVMAANNETGVIQPMAEVARLAGAAGVAVHSDMVQSLGKTPVDFAGSGLDYASLSAHKIGGPAGVGAVLAREGRALQGITRGGGQERGRRAGTENVIGIAGFAAAALAAAGDIEHYGRMAAWRDAMEARVVGARGDATVFSAGADRLANTSCIALGGRGAQSLVMALDLAGVATSAGSACSSGKVHESHVLRAMGAGDAAGRAIRISGGWKTCSDDFEKVAQVLAGL